MVIDFTVDVTYDFTALCNCPIFIYAFKTARYMFYISVNTLQIFANIAMGSHMHR